MQTDEMIKMWLSEGALPVALSVLIVVALFVSTRPRKIRALTGWCENEYSFVNSLLIRGFDPIITRTTFRYLQEKQSASVPIKANDKLAANLGLGPADIEQSFQDLLRLNGRQYRPEPAHAPLATVHDLVSLIQASPRLSDLAA